MISDTYLKMLLALPPETLSNHELQDGDLVYCDYTPDGLTYFKTYCIVGTMHWEGACDPVYWIPSQRQLQNMIKLQLGHDVTDFYILKYVTAWHERGDLNRLENVCSEVLFLEVLMWMKGKIWNGDKWL